MTRIRTVKPEWLEDELMVFASSDARVLSVALILLADDYGNGRCNRQQLAMRVFPAPDDSDESVAKSSRTLREALEELIEIRFVGVYETERQHYFTIRKWREHQRVDHPGKPLVPSPPENIWSNSRESRETLAPDLDLDLEGKREDDSREDATGPSKQEISETRKRVERWTETECPEELTLNDVHQKLADRIGEPLSELWEDFRAKRRAKGARAAMPDGWIADFEGWLRTFARNEAKKSNGANPQAPPKQKTAATETSCPDNETLRTDVAVAWCAKLEVSPEDEMGRFRKAFAKRTMPASEWCGMFHSWIREGLQKKSLRAAKVETTGATITSLADIVGSIGGNG